MRDNKDDTVDILFYAREDKKASDSPFVKKYYRVNKSVPKKRNGADPYARNCLWVQLIEKALTLSGLRKKDEDENDIEIKSYFDIASGSGCEAMELLLGKISRPPQCIENKDKSNAQRLLLESLSNLITQKGQYFENKFINQIIALISEYLDQYGSLDLGLYKSFITKVIDSDSLKKFIKILKKDKKLTELYYQSCDDYYFDNEEIRTQCENYTWKLVTQFDFEKTIYTVNIKPIIKIEKSIVADLENIINQKIKLEASDLLDSHAYSIIDYTQDDNRKFIRLINPHAGRSGPINIKNATDGSFLIELSHFANIVSSISICELKKKEEM